MVTLKITNVNIRTDNKGKNQKEVCFDVLFTSEGNNLFDGFRIKADTMLFKVEATDEKIQTELEKYLKPFNDAFEKKNESTDEEKQLQIQRKNLTGKQIKSNGN